MIDDRTKFLLGKMLGLLGSDHDGEVVAAARQIKRLLESKGLSFGDLVSLVNGAPSRGAEKTNDLLAMAEIILENETMMREHEARFVRDIAARSRLRGFEMTQKQANWFSFLYMPSMANRSTT